MLRFIVNHRKSAPILAVRTPPCISAAPERSIDRSNRTHSNGAPHDLALSVALNSRANRICVRTSAVPKALAALPTSRMTENNVYVPPQVKSEMSDESEYDAEPEEFDIYKRKYQLLLDRCEVLQQDNERLVYRIQRVRKLLKRTRKEKKFLIDRLDQHGDKWREAPMGVLEENSVFQTTLKPEKGAKPGAQCPKEEKPKKGTKRKGGKADPNAPKRPANPFFQFCQEQRPRVMERLAGEPEPSKQELTRQLATTWKSLTSEDKKVYYDMYERSKEKYVAEMQIYNKKAEDAPPQPALNVT